MGNNGGSLGPVFQEETGYVDLYGYDGTSLSEMSAGLYCESPLPWIPQSSALSQCHFLPSRRTGSAIPKCLNLTNPTNNVGRAKYLKILLEPDRLSTKTCPTMHEEEKHSIISSFRENFQHQYGQPPTLRFRGKIRKEVPHITLFVHF